MEKIVIYRSDFNSHVSNAGAKYTIISRTGTSTINLNVITLKGDKTMKNTFTFQNKENRDKKVKDLKVQGFKVKKSSISDQYTHPMYIEDWRYQLTEEEKGFGNCLYKTFFSRLYRAEIIE